MWFCSLYFYSGGIMQEIFLISVSTEVWSKMTENVFMQEIDVLFFSIDGLFFFELIHVLCEIQTNVFKLRLNLCIMLPFLIKLLAAWSDMLFTKQSQFFSHLLLGECSFWTQSMHYALINIFNSSLLRYCHNLIISCLIQWVYLINLRNKYYFASFCVKMATFGRLI